MSRYKFDRSQEAVTMQELYCGQVRVSGCKFWQDLSWEQDSAKTMTSLLILPSVVSTSITFVFLKIKGNNHLVDYHLDCNFPLAKS